MEEIREFILDEVLFQLEAYYNVSIDVGRIIAIIDDEYANYVKDVNDWDAESYIGQVIKRYLG